MNSNEDMEKRTTGQEKTDKDVLVKPIPVDGVEKGQITNKNIIKLPNEIESNYMKIKKLV